MSKDSSYPTIPTPDEIIQMVESCSTEELKELLEIEPNNLYGMMVSLAVKYEYSRRRIDFSPTTVNEKNNIPSGEDV